MKKTVKEYNEKSIAVLKKESLDMRKEIATMRLNSQVSPQKDTNSIIKKRNKLAIILTLISQKETKDKFEKAIK